MPESAREFDITVGHYLHTTDAADSVLRLSDPYPVAMFASVLTATHYVKFRSATDRSRYYYLTAPNAGNANSVPIHRTYRAGEKL